MSDFEYDCHQKKVIARGANKKINGSKSKRCGLPSDGMTTSQWKRMCGAVETYNLGAPTTWERFKTWGTDIQREYLAKLVDRYLASADDISKMLGVHEVTLRAYVRKRLSGVTFCRKGKLLEQEWEFFVDRSLYHDGAAEVKPEEEQEACHDSEDCAVDTEAYLALKEFSLVFDGAVRADVIANSIVNMAGKGACGRVEIKYFAE